MSRAVEYQEVTYEVAALVAVPSCLGYGYYGADEFVLNDVTFCQDTQSDSVMLYAFNTQEGGATPWRTSWPTTRKTRIPNTTM